MGFWTPSNPAINDSLATSVSHIQSNFTMIQGVLGSNTLSAGITWAQGGIPYAGAVQTISQLAKSTDSCMLTNYGTNNNPSWVKFTNMTFTGTYSGTSVLATTMVVGTVSGAYTGQMASQATILGAWVDKSASYGAQQAPCDGLVIGYISTDNVMAGFTDVNANPVTKRAGSTAGDGDFHTRVNSIMMPVRRGDYWKVVVDGGAPAVYWIPFGV